MIFTVLIFFFLTNFFSSNGCLIFRYPFWNHSYNCLLKLYWFYGDTQKNDSPKGYKYLQIIKVGIELNYIENSSFINIKNELYLGILWLYV